MMSYEFWVKQLLDVMRLIADREYQVRRWLAADTKAWEHPGELMITVFDDFTFELFIEMYAGVFTEEQLNVCKHFDNVATHWCSTTPDWPDERKTIDSPDWIKVRAAAADFIRVFNASKDVA